MHFEKFTIVSQRDVQALEDTHEIILLNLDHIVSVKPIKIVVDTEVLQGYWIRMTNGKKYRAIEVPNAIAQLCVEN
ncbi:hypothetical protein [Bacteriovorax sp. DB6_IX]|uniref:hypothetical protein n=1 Tax=Bacteriovorax sp. DB6_IX TaxID=1353530 RepID=UPI000389F88C|nr:hypothetical protein [Bacteriovorax sp. DB6_IX]EQC52390.1 hypothetical protein M901_0398 [Bacteriovorax sp. DB6_IX]